MKNMKKIKDRFLGENLKWRYSDDTTPLVARKSLKIGVGLFLIAFAVIFMLKNIATTDDTYKHISTPPITAFKDLEFNQKEKQVTLILYRSKCKACLSVESNIAKKVNEMRKKSGSDIQVVNVLDLEKPQLSFIQKNLSGILVNGNKIPTPLVANLTITEKGIIINKFSNTANFKNIDKILSMSN